MPSDPCTASPDGPASWLVCLTSVLGRRMLLWILAISAVMAVMATSVQLLSDYRRDVSDLEQAMRYIEENQLPGLADAAWNFHADALRVQLEGIGRSPWVAGALVRYGPNQAAELSSGAIDLGQPEVLQFPLHRNVGSNAVVVGHVYIAPNLRDLYGRTIRRVAVVLSTQAVKSLVISTCILLLVSGMITRHLTQMAEFAKSFQVGETFSPFTLHRAARVRRDELTVLAECLNDAYRRLHTAHEFEVRHNEILSREVALRTAELQEAHRAIAKLATTDRLTGMVNRLGLEEAFTRELARAQRYQGPMAVILADVDKFKAVNDCFGHQVGDIVLKEFASVLQGEARHTDIVGRWGGEEFLILCPETDAEAAAVLAERMRASVAGHDFPQVGTRTGSFGVAAFRAGDSEAALVKRADDALYRAKNGGRDRVERELAD